MTYYYTFISDGDGWIRGKVYHYHNGDRVIVDYLGRACVSENTADLDLEAWFDAHPEITDIRLG